MCVVFQKIHCKDHRQDKREQIKVNTEAKINTATVFIKANSLPSCQPQA